MAIIVDAQLSGEAFADGLDVAEDGPYYTDGSPGDLVNCNPMDSIIIIIYEEISSVPTLTLKLMGGITSDLAVFRDLPDDLELEGALVDYVNPYPTGAA